MDPAARLAILRQASLLAPLDESELEDLLRSCRDRLLQPGEALCLEGEAGHALYVVLSGHLVVSKVGKQVAVSSPGDVLGEMALVESRERAATLRALDETLVLEIPQETFDRLIAPNPRCLSALVKVFSERSRRDLESLAADNLKLQSIAEEVERSNRELNQIRRQLEEKNRLLERLSALDTLTGIANRGRFDAVLRQEWRRAAREEAPLSLVFCDIDHFKRFNDTYGHQAGDECLVRVAQAMDESLNRPGDMAARYGGEEFVALLVDTDTEGARLLADRIRARIESMRIEHRTSGVCPWLTVSFGIATVRPDASGRPEDLVALADGALYEAKQGGRNRVIGARAGSGPDQR